MSWLPALAVGGPVLVTARSAEAALLTVSVVEDVLLAVLGSGVVLLLIVAVLMICAPLATVVLTVTVIVKVSE